MPGNSVSTSKRITASRLRGGGLGFAGGLRLRGLVGGLGRLLDLDLLPPLQVLLEDRGAVLRRLGPDALPVLDAGRAERDALVPVGDVRVVGAEFLDHLAVARL